MENATGKLYKYRILLNNKVYEESDFLTIREIDEKFTRYENSEHFKIFYELEKRVNLDDKKLDIEILYFYNKENDRYKKLPVLFNEDEDVLITEGNSKIRTADQMFLGYITTPEVVLDFFSYLDEKRLSNIESYNKVIAELTKSPKIFMDTKDNTKPPYLDSLIILLDKLKGSYAVSRAKYVAIKDFLSGKLDEKKFKPSSGYSILFFQ